MGNLAQLPKELLVQQIQNGLILLGLGMGVVFCFLVILILSTKLMSKFVNKKPKVNKVETEKKVSTPVLKKEESAQVTKAVTYSSESKDVLAPMSGLILRIEVSEGQKVQKNQLLMVMEAMKMENEIYAPCEGIVKNIKVKCGDQLNLSDLLVTIAPANIQIKPSSVTNNTIKTSNNNVASVTSSSNLQGDVEIKAPMPGAILKLSVKEGDTVKVNQGILVMEAMKMENEVFSPANGVVKSIKVKIGDQVNPGDLMIIIGSKMGNNAVQNTVISVPTKDFNSSSTFVPKPTTPMRRTGSTAPARRSTANTQVRRAVVPQRPTQSINNQSVQEKSTPTGNTEMKSPLSGQILKINVKVGDKVSKNQLLMVMEAMKMENEIFAPCDGTIVSINVKQGQQLNNDDLLLIIG